MAINPLIYLNKDYISFMEILHINNYKLHYIEEGAGSPVIFVHGSISDYRGWMEQIPIFSKHFRTIAYNRRYHFPSASDEVNVEYTVPNHSKDLTAFIKALNVDSVHLVGSSYGAYVCLMTAINHPDLVKTLVLGEPPVIPLLVSNLDNPVHILSLLIKDWKTGKSFLNFGMKAMFPAKKQFRKGNLEDGVRLFANGVLGAGGFENLPEASKEKLLDNAQALKLELLRPDYPEISKRDYSTLQVPVLLVCGERSPTFFCSISNKLHKLLPKSEKVEIPDVSHNMHMVNPESYNQKVLEFLIKHN